MERGRSRHDKKKKGTYEKTQMWRGVTFPLEFVVKRKREDGKRHRQDGGQK